MKKPTKSDRPYFVAKEYTGRYVAWSPDGKWIVGAGKTFEEAELDAKMAGYNEVAIVKISRDRTISG